MKDDFPTLWPWHSFIKRGLNPSFKSLLKNIWNLLLWDIFESIQSVLLRIWLSWKTFSSGEFLVHLSFGNHLKGKVLYFHFFFFVHFHFLWKLVLGISNISWDYQYPLMFPRIHHISFTNNHIRLTLEAYSYEMKYDSFKKNESSEICNKTTFHLEALGEHKTKKWQEDQENII